MAEELSDSSPDEPQLPRLVINGELLYKFCRSSMKLNGLIIVGKCCGYLYFGKKDQIHFKMHGNYWKHLLIS